MSAEASKEQQAELLTFWVNVIAGWADRMPLRDVYIFGAHARGEAEPEGKLKIAIEYDENAKEEIVMSWQRENATGFAELNEALGIDIKLYIDQDYGVWPAIREAARAPLMTVRKVRVLQTPEL